MRGRSIPLSAPRRFLIDMLHFASQVPSVPVQRCMKLAEVAAARSAAVIRVGWPALFLKAFARVAARTPELRRVYISFPWPRLYEYPSSIANVAIERDYEGEKAVFFGRINSPDELPLPEIESRMRALVETPIPEVKSYRKMLKLAKLPRPLRWLAMWLALNLPRSRPAHFGTFGLSVYSSLGAESLHPISPLTTTMTYGVIASDGSVNVRLIYDHRVLDGAVVARVLARMEEELTGPICEELRALAMPNRTGVGSVTIVTSPV